MKTVRIQVVKVYDIEVDGDPDDAISNAYDLQTTEIESRGRLVDCTSDNAEIV